MSVSSNEGKSETQALLIKDIVEDIRCEKNLPRPECQT